MATFVLEIGSEEVPSRFLPTEEQELETRFTAALEENALEHGKIRALSTPRRAILVVEDLNPVQTEREEVVAGPPVRVAYDADGKPTKALEGFVRTNGCTLDDVFRQETPKGEYVAVRKRIGGAAAGDLLATICPAIITALPFAKRMRWGANHVAYARPLRWIVALLDGEVVPFEVGPVASGRETCGHRIHGRGPFSVAHANDLLPLLADKGGITPLPADRRAAIVSGGDAQAAAVGGKVLWKDSLLRSIYWKMVQYKDAGDLSAFREKDRELEQLQKEFDAYKEKTDRMVWTCQDYEHWYAISHNLSSFTLEEGAKKERNTCLARERGLLVWKKIEEGYCCPVCHNIAGKETPYCPICGIRLEADE